MFCKEKESAYRPWCICTNTQLQLSILDERLVAWIWQVFLKHCNTNTADLALKKATTNDKNVSHFTISRTSCKISSSKWQSKYEILPPKSSALFSAAGSSHLACIFLAMRMRCSATGWDRYCKMAAFFFTICAIPSGSSMDQLLEMTCKEMTYLDGLPALQVSKPFWVPENRRLMSVAVFILQGMI